MVRFKNGQGSNLDGGNYHVYENGSLEIKMIRKEDQGIYTCVATNILGKAENQVRLEVKGKQGVHRREFRLGRKAMLTGIHRCRGKCPCLGSGGHQRVLSVTPADLSTGTLRQFSNLIQSLPVSPHHHSYRGFLSQRTIWGF